MFKLRQEAISRITEKVCNAEGEECEETDNSDNYPVEDEECLAKETMVDMPNVTP